MFEVGFKFTKQSVQNDNLIHILVLDSIASGLKRKKPYVLKLARKGFLENIWFELTLEGHLRLKLSFSN